MATKPADFFIGVVDFFAIILPGALLSYMALHALKQHGSGLMLLVPEGTAPGWVAFALSAYLLGHFASLIGAFFLDPLYKLSYVRWHARTGDQIYGHAGKLKAKELGANDVTTYKWARMSIRLRNASAMQEIDRLEADSKFFRSVTIVLLISPCIITSYRGTFWGVSLWALLVLLAFLRFANLRWKAAEAAYVAIVALENTRVKKAAETSAL
jgi:hypothetical protein